MTYKSTEGAASFREREIASSQVEKINDFLELLIKWNQRFNLTSRSDTILNLGFLVNKSLAFFSLLPEVSEASVLDIGSGAGFPAIIGALVAPEWKFTLVESRGHRNRFLAHVKRALSLANVTVIPDRFPSKQLAECCFTYVTSMLVSHHEQLLTPMIRSLLPQGRALLTIGHTPNLKNLLAQLAGDSPVRLILHQHELLSTILMVEKLNHPPRSPRISVNDKNIIQIE